ncbi:hypothetical protein JTE90_022151 [Oedothorax gibbosus]|uniref:Uncharacterized protein n=1 Tax=Oedothorax gibbosus TaxID=931172 RepID=A0AAV6VSN7_9ARAC|nr:hypothetical protein JTE90_022151 [Oedothorax gibbosus]
MDKHSRIIKGMPMCVPTMDFGVVERDMVKVNTETLQIVSPSDLCAKEEGVLGDDLEEREEMVEMEILHANKSDKKSL